MMRVGITRPYFLLPNERIKYQKFDKSADIDMVIKIMNHFDSYFVPWLSEKTDLFALSEKISKNAYILIAYDNDKIVGFAAFYINKEIDVTYLTVIAVDKNYQRNGTGKSLINKMIDISKEYQINKIRLETKFDSEPLQKFYKQFGFEITEAFMGIGNIRKCYMELLIKEI
jgi:ribosomal protein S18 acetylase RimI-like enzyme